MKIDVSAVRSCLKSFDFETLFREHLGWDNYHAQIDIVVDTSPIRLTAVAQKRGFVAFVYPSIPDRVKRIKIDHQITKSVREHLIIYTDQSLKQQVWQWVRRDPGKPLASRDHRFDSNQLGDPLIQRLDQLAVSLDEEELINIVDITGRARAAFDVDKVTKKFFDRFKNEHNTFLSLIKGIKTEADLEWYTSIMLNRLMFIYFIQKKGFLDGDLDYLRNRLAMVQQAKGQDKFQSFYRYFLLRLFHEGLGKSIGNRTLDPVLEKLLGDVPFLNGGFFEVHQLETRYTDIDIPDKAFEKLFDFFDQYSWHLDERPLRADNEINPDVVGYIFEKYINQKQMGAYYTKEDITEYISKNTIIPFLFDNLQRECEAAFRSEDSIWHLLRDNPDRYIFDAIRHGIIETGKIVALPEDIEAGIDDISKRGIWNQPASDQYGLPNETWREYIARRQRCLTIHTKLSDGEIRDINELVTLNLDIWQFARDVINNTEDPELLRAFWHAIKKITILDPTCGSGAFLFSALGILETLYSDCLERMERFIEDSVLRTQKNEQYSDFESVLNQIAKHPNARYFILKSIIINNLFGVDIMEEAVEICKLRLFLKLVAQVDRVDQIEPLPDIDFNIRVGNTLVGYATYHEVKRALMSKLDVDNVMARIDVKAKKIESCFATFRRKQIDEGCRPSLSEKSKLKLALKDLESELNLYLAREYEIDITKENTFNAWLVSHKPFHWFIEFYGILKFGGFDVVIGNPPYVEYHKIRNDYTIKRYITEKCGNLYGFVMERSNRLIKNGARFGFIVPISFVCTQRMEILQNFLDRKSEFQWLSNYAERPGKLFSGAEVILTIVLTKKGDEKSNVFTTGFNKWTKEERETLFSRISYAELSQKPREYILPKIGLQIEKSIVKKILSQNSKLGYNFTNNSEYKLYYRIGGGRYWKIFTNFQPKFTLNGIQSVSSRENYIYFENPKIRDTTIAILSSSLFYWFFILSTNCRDLNPSDLKEFPFDMEKVNAETSNQFCSLIEKLMKDYQEKSEMKQKISSLTGHILYQEFYPRLSKPLIDEIDKELSKIYEFTDEELDFIINYDIKYRMGSESDDNELE